MRNEVVHAKPASPIDVSKIFICSYVSSILSLESKREHDLVKGKFVLDYESPMLHVSVAAKVDSGLKWLLPVQGFVKLNTDGLFFPADGTSSTGMVL